jgi:RNA polymerase sigma factor (sigma-70 family)
MLKHPLLTAQDEFQLAREYKVGMQIEAQFKVLEEQLGRRVSDADVAQSLDIDSAQVRSLLERMENAKSVLTGANMRLVFHIARYYKFRGVAYPDLVQEGTFGLIKAIQKYDPDRGFRFSTYASWWIKQSVSRAIAEKSRLIRLPVHIHDMMVSIAKVEREFSVQHSRKPTPQEVSERLALPLHKVELLMRCAQDVNSIDDNAFQNRGKAEAGGVQVKEKIASQTSGEPATLSTRNSLRAELRRAMNVLSEVSVRFAWIAACSHCLCVASAAQRSVCGDLGNIYLICMVSPLGKQKCLHCVSMPNVDFPVSWLF